MRNERPDAFDALIDDAARRLVAGEPSPALRVGVRDRIGRRRSVWLLVPAWGAAIAVVIAVVFVGSIVFDGLGDRRSSGNQRAAIEHPPEQPRSVDAPPDTAPAPIQPAQTEARQFTRRLATAVLPPPVEEESPIPPIAIEPLTTVPLGTAQIAADDGSGVTPIEIPPLQIEPLLGQ